MATIHFMRPPFAITLAVLPCLLVACQGAPAPARLPVTAAQYDRALDTAAATLRRHGLHVARFDPRMGMVATSPESIPTSAEWWQGNAPNGSDWEAQANLQDLRHVARIRLTPAANGGYTLQAEVTVERLDRPTQRVNASAWSPAGHLSEVPAHWQNRGVIDHQWQKIGRDAALEAQLMRDIAAGLAAR